MYLKYIYIASLKSQHNSVNSIPIGFPDYQTIIYRPNFLYDSNVCHLRRSFTFTECHEQC